MVAKPMRGMKGVWRGQIGVTWGRKLEWGRKRCKGLAAPAGGKVGLGDKSSGNKDGGRWGWEAWQEVV
jgi:hypothetical protein